MHRAKTSGLFGIALLGSLLIASAAQAGVIDSFSSVGGPGAWPKIDSTVGSVTDVESGLTGVMGGVRSTTRSITSLGIPGLDSVQTTILPAFSIFDYASSAGANGAVQFLYNSGGSLHANFLNEQSIQIAFGSFDLAFGAPLPVTVTLSDGIASASLSHSLISAGAGTLTFLVSDFAGIGGVNLADISSVKVNLDPGTAADFRLTGITTVTVPTPGALALLGAAGMVAIRRRRAD